MSLLAQSRLSRKIIFYVVQFFVSSFNYATILINGTNFARILFTFFKSDSPDSSFQDNLWFYKLITILFMLLLMIIIASSAYLKIPSLLSTAIIIISLVIFWCKNTFEIGLQNWSNMKPFLWAQALPLISSQVYSIESIGTLLTIRQAMKRAYDMKRVIYWVFLISLLLFMFNGWSFYATFTERSEIAFFYFSQDNVLILVLKFCFYLTLPATMAITLFALMAVVDSFDCVKGALKSEDNQETELINKVGHAGELIEDDPENEENNSKGNFYKKCICSNF